MADPVRTLLPVIQARCQPGFAALVDRAAQARGTTTSEWLRQAARTALRLDGFDPLVVDQPRDAGALYDLVEGKRCYAWVEGDAIKAMSYSADWPQQEGRTWLLVEHEDSEPFDVTKHWRLPPIDRIEADRVVRTFPIVPKSLEFA